MDYQKITDELKKIDLVKYIGSYTKLKRTGNLYQGHCVLHPDSETPSLTVYPDSNSYYCFGCKSGGSIIEFVKAYYNYDFHETLAYLAEKEGIDLDIRESPQDKARRSRITANQRQIMENQKRLLEAEKVAEYLRKRGFNDKTISHFNLGYDSEDNSIVIPINDGFGKPVGFSRRFLNPGKGPKYINSRNDEVFNKGQILYNLDKARKHAQDGLVVVEGYFDVLSAWQSGFGNAVAVCKDTMTEEQAQMVVKICKDKKVLLVPDNDDTGKASVLKNKDILRAADPSLVIQVAMPEDSGKDLNDVLLQAGEEGVRRVIENAKPVDLYTVEYLLSQEPVREQQYNRIRDYIKKIDNILVVEDIVKLLTDKWEMKEGIIRQHLELGAGKTQFWYPHDRVLERKMLSLLMQKPKDMDLVADRLTTNCFHVLEHRIIFETMLQVYRKKGVLTNTEVYLSLKNNSALDDVEELLSSLSSNVIGHSETDALMESLLSLFYQRQLLQATLEIAESISGRSDDDFDKIQARAQNLVFAATDHSTTTPVHRLDSLVAKSWEEYMARMEGKAPRALMTGFFSLDKIITGFKKKHLIVLAGTTSTGKTAMALNIVRNVLSRQPSVPVGIVTLEMTAQEIVDRLIVSELNVNSKRFDQGSLTDEELKRFQQKMGTFHQKPLLISDERGLTVAQIRARLRRMKAVLGELGLVVVDYLQTIQLEVSNNISTARATGDVVLQLRNMAAELDTPVLLLSQINRNYSHRQDKRPQLPDLRESGNIEEFADVVLFLYRHAKMGPAALEESRSKSEENVVDVIVAKNRTGPTDNLKLEFDEQFMRFTDPETRSIESSVPAPYKDR